MDPNEKDFGMSSYGSTYLYKLADGVFNNSWHQRYFVFDGHKKELTYFKTEKDKKSRGHFKLAGATVSEITSVKGQDHAFTITNKSGNKKMNLAGHSIEEAQLWREIIIKVSDENNKDPYLKLIKLDSLKMTQSTIKNRKVSVDSDEPSSTIDKNTSAAFQENPKFSQERKETEVKEDEELYGDGNYIDEEELQSK